MFRYTVIFLSLQILFKGAVLISNKCSIPNNVKVLVKLQASVTNETIYYLSPMKANKYTLVIFSFHLHLMLLGYGPQLKFGHIN